MQEGGGGGGYTGIHVHKNGVKLVECGSRYRRGLPVKFAVGPATQGLGQVAGGQPVAKTCMVCVGGSQVVQDSWPVNRRKVSPFNCCLTPSLP